ncbi:MAG: DUF333 domain-containing protein [archaeon]
MRKELILILVLFSAFLLFGCEQGVKSRACADLAPEQRNTCCAEKNVDTPHDACEGEWLWNTESKECYFSCSGGELANPASEYCNNQGHKLEIISAPDGQYGICKFVDGTECEEWDYYRGKCKPGDKKIAVPVNEEQCTSLGGEWGLFGLADVERCNLPTKDGGKLCTDGSNCEAGICIAESIGAISGNCPEWKMNFGCFNIVENGKGIGLCID